MKIFSFDDFYVLGPAFNVSAIHVRPIDVSINPYHIARAEKQVETTLDFQVSCGSSEVDFVASEDPPLCLISSKMENLLLENNLTGWRTFPISLASNRQNFTNEYRGFAVSGRCGPIQNQRSTKVTCLPPEGGRPYEAYKGLFFDKGSWDRSDIFMPADFSYIIVSARTKTILTDARLSNLDFVGLPDFERLPSEL